jgi:hypothetical protein
LISKKTASRAVLGPVERRNLYLDDFLDDEFSADHDDSAAMAHSDNRAINAGNASTPAVVLNRS